MKNLGLTFIVMFLTIVAATVSFADSKVSADAKLHYSNNFNNGWGDVILGGYCPKVGDDYTYRSVTKEGPPKHSHQFWLEKGYACTRISKNSACYDSSGNRKTRSLILPGRSFGDERTRLYINDHHWMGYRMYIHPQTTALSHDADGPILMQVTHNGRSRDNSTIKFKDKGELIFKSGISHENSHFKTVKIGQWVNVVTHLNFTSKGRGLIEIWMDGKKVHEEEGPVEAISADNFFRQHVGTYMGAYDIYDNYAVATCYDDIKIATGEDAFNLVSPTKSDTEPSAPNLRQ